MADTINGHGRHPMAVWFRNMAIAVGVLWACFRAYDLLVWFLSFGWMNVGIMVAIALAVWAKAAKKFDEFIKGEPERGVVIGILLTLPYATGAWFWFKWFAPWLIKLTAVEPRQAWIVSVILAAYSIPQLWRLYAATGVPGNREDIAKGCKILMWISLAFFAWWFWQSPDQFFDHTNGQVMFWVDDAVDDKDVENKIYYSAGHSRLTGEKLRPGTAVDAKKFATKKRWPERAAEKLDKATKPIQDWWNKPASRGSLVRTGPVRCRISWLFTTDNRTNEERERDGDRGTAYFLIYKLDTNGFDIRYNEKNNVIAWVGDTEGVQCKGSYTNEYMDTITGKQVTDTGEVTFRLVGLDSGTSTTGTLTQTNGKAKGTKQTFKLTIL